MSLTSIFSQEQPWFDYSSLKLKSTGQMRLMQILPGTDFPIRCAISVHDRTKSSNYTETLSQSDVIGWFPIADRTLDHLGKFHHSGRSSWDSPQRERYVCLSYQWHRKTDSNDMHTIRLNGQPFSVRDNLFNFLVKARDRLHSILIWIDAICIDQSNIDERNDQVKAMGAIFGAAACVIIWLGSFQVSISDVAWIRKCQHRVGGTFDELIVILKALRNEYWTRAWITQEVSLASTCLVWSNTTASRWPGPILTPSMSKPMTLERFERLYRQLIKTGSISATDVSKLLGMRSSMMYELRPLQEIMEQHKNANCAEVVDRIYALRSLCLEGNDIEVKYGSTKWDLLCRVMWACRGAFCLCLVLHLLDALQLREELEINCSSAGILHLPGVSGSLRTSQLTRSYISVTTARPANLIHGPGLPLAKSTLNDLDKIFQQFSKSRALRTCDCTRAVVRAWRSKQGISLCAKLLCQGHAFDDVHIFFENRRGLFRATGFRTSHHAYYVQDGFPGIFLNSGIDRSHRLVMTLTIHGLLQVMSLLPKHGRAEHPTKRRRPAHYELVYEHLWDHSSQPVSVTHNNRYTFQRLPISIDWLLEKLDMPKQPRRHFQLLISSLSNHGTELLYGRTAYEPLPGDIRHRHRVHRVHQPHTRVRRRRFANNGGSNSKLDEIVTN